MMILIRKNYQKFQGDRYFKKYEIFSHIKLLIIFNKHFLNLNQRHLYVENAGMNLNNKNKNKHLNAKYKSYRKPSHSLNLRR